MTKLIAYCGIDCAECEGYLATQADDNAKRAEVASQWSVQYNADLKAEHINCDGCREDGRKLYFCENICEIRKCCIKKGLNNCAECDEYPCEIVEGFAKIAPKLRAALDALRAK